MDFHVAITSTGRGVQRYRLKGIVERIVEEKTVAVGSYPKTVTAVDFQYGNVISSGTTSGSTSSATGTTDAQTSQTDAYGNVISGSDSTTQGTTDDEGSAFNSNIPAPLQSQDSGDGVSTQDWITNEKLGIDENNNSY